MADDWEDVDVPTGSYLSWASKPGQRVVGKVIDYEPHGGTNFNGEECALLTIRLSEDAYSVNKDGERYDFGADDMIMINCGLVGLARAVKFANIERGDLVDIHYYDKVKVEKGDAKQFKIRVLRASKAGKGSTNGGEPPLKRVISEPADIPF